MAAEPDAEPAPAVAPAGRQGSLTFVGTATTVLRLGGFTVLTDPNFLRRGQRAYLGRGLWTRRVTEPAFGVTDVPPLDCIVLSHLHGDHFDRVARRGLARSTPLLTTPHAARRLSRKGFTTTGLDTWDDHVLRRGAESLRVQSLPGVHARGLLGRVLPPVMGSLLEYRAAGEGDPYRIYLSGDTLTGDHLDQVREHCPQIDVAVLHLGGTRVLAATVTMDAAQGVDFLRRVRPRTAVPVHYDDYRVFRSPLSDFLDRASSSGFGPVLRTVGRGQTVALP